MTAWTLLPGSDTPGDRIVPWVSVASGTYHYALALVDLFQPGAGAGTGDGWQLWDAGLAWTFDTIDNAGGESFTVRETAPAGRYLAACYYDTVYNDSPPPLPAGWLPVEGPKFLGEADGYLYFGGRVHLAVDTLVPSNWYLGPDDGIVSLNKASNGIGVTSSGGETAPAGDYVASYFAEDGAAVAWPAGFTPLTSVCGPIAITDENAGAVIDDIAYVVSGYVYNGEGVAAVLEGWRGVLGPGEYTAAVGDLFSTTSHSAGVRRVTGAGTFTVNVNGNYIADTATVEAAPGLGYWPYLERFDLTTKKWLPRIKLPKVVAAVPEFVPTDPPFQGEWVDGVSTGTGDATLLSADWTLQSLGPWTGGMIAAPTGPPPGTPPPDTTVYWGYIVGLPDGGQQVFYNSDGYRTADTNIPSGGTLYRYTQGVGLAEEDLPPLPASRLARPAKYYAAEGGFAGAIGGKLYFGGGDGSDITGKEFFSYDPATQTFERLDDVPDLEGRGGPPDYNPFGVSAGSLFALRTLAHDEADAGMAMSYIEYTPGSGWTSGDLVSATDGTSVTDQIQGVEIGGKLYFVYDRVYVFDPAALTVEAKAAPPSALNVPCAVWGDGSNVFVAGSDGAESGLSRYFKYTVAGDSWTTTGDTGSVQPNYAAAVYRNGEAFVLSGTRLYDIDGNEVRLGVYALLGSAFTAPPVKHLVHLGFAPRQAAVLQADPATVPIRSLLRAGFSPRQAKTLKRGDRSLKALIRGGFTTHQARALEDS